MLGDRDKFTALSEPGKVGVPYNYLRKFIREPKETRINESS